MRQEFLDILMCPACRNNTFHVERALENDIEIREGRLFCKGCGMCFDIKDGIVDFLKNPSTAIIREKKAMHEEEYIKDESGKRYKITDETIDRFRDQFLSLPEGDGSYFFKRGGSFQSVKENSERFYKMLSSLSLNGKERVLEIGAGFCWASYKIAGYGCSVVAADISDYIKAGRVYLDKAYFERVWADMHRMPFADDTFDIVFGSAVMHHTKDLRGAFSEIRRVLKKGGRLALINESTRGIFEKIHPDLKELDKRGFSDASYVIPEWRNSALEAGFRKVEIDFLSLADEYIMRHRDRKSKGLKMRLAYFLKRHRAIERALLFLLILPRILFRPKSWQMICCK